MEPACNVTGHKLEGSMHRYVLIAVTLYAVVNPVPIVGQGRFFDSGGVRIHYEQVGIGEPVVLVHGNGATMSSWSSARVVQDLSKDHRVITLDCRGSGESGKPHSADQYGREMGLDIIRLLDHLGVAKAHIVGYSMGGEITHVLLTTHPDRFLTATVAGYAGRFRWTAEEQRQTELEASEIERDGVSRSMVLRLSPPGQRRPTDEEIVQRQKAALADPAFDRRALAARMRSAKDRVITAAEVSSVRVPTLAIAGSLDPNLAGLRELVKLRPAVKLVVIEGATHGGSTGAMSRPEFVAAIRDLMTSNGSTGKR
jgi:pimeloyl-ACP methyl ester carboxylesterase